ncbi:MAG: outer membrane protein transport protein [Planctomycetota bacterium]|nr:outer membrane protein transport protein [Planctomycetota bacterium]
MMLLVTPAFGQAGAGAFVFYENGSPDMGASYAGAGARANDAATAFTNPAGMVRLKGSHLLLGTFLLVPTFDLDVDAGSTTVPAGFGAILDGGDLGGVAPGLGSFGVFQINDQFNFGFSINAIAANGADYDTNWAGRAFVTENFLIAMNFEPALSYKIDDKWSVGAGLNLVYMSLEQDFKATNDPLAPTVKIDDADDWEVGATLGVMYQHSEDTRFGLTYRTEMEFNLDGDFIVPVPDTLNFDSDMKLPQGVNGSVYHRINDKLAVLGDVGWTEWSAFSRVPTTIGPISFTADRNWDDTWHVGIGLEYMMNETWLLRTGFAYDSSPVDDDKLLPDIPVGEQYRFSVGVQKIISTGITFGLSYTLMYSPMEIDKVVLPPSGDVTLDADYDDPFVHFIGMTISLTF